MECFRTGRIQGPNRLFALQIISLKFPIFSLFCYNNFCHREHRGEVKKLRREENKMFGIWNFLEFGILYFFSNFEFPLKGAGGLI